MWDSHQWSPYLSIYHRCFVYRMNMLLIGHGYGTPLFLQVRLGTWSKPIDLGFKYQKPTRQSLEKDAMMIAVF